MAIVQWLERIEAPSLSETFAPLVQELQLEYLASVSSDSQLYATTPPAKVSRANSPRVSVLVMWTDRRGQEVQIEVRSDEPMLRPRTHCEHIAEKLRGLLQRESAA